ncbi:MAG: Asp-tRNA(Asn)/Glu-tRNA(Gln) amidotransferase subunit GatC [Acidobacteria bacterium]|nr:Asp-tRNA(Asn)/Glu-tRNA(Gln) amidotransferase subunit GatC [Acidobacteriota bacterium]
MSITKQDVEKIAGLANLALSEEEKECFTTQLSSIVSYIEKLNKLDTEDVLPMSHSTLSGDTLYTMREDKLVASLGQSKALANAPDGGEDHFRVPKVIG